MNITGNVWMQLTWDERMICLAYAAEENAKRMARKSIKR